MKRIIGTVSSNKADKTIVITVTRRKTHPMYGKQYTDTSRYIAHDEKNQAGLGDIVEIVETRPISKRKAFKLDRIIEAGRAAVELKDEEILVEKPKADKPEADKQPVAKAKPAKKTAKASKEAEPSS